MAIPAAPATPLDLNTAVALDLLAAAYAADDIMLRTGIAPDDLYGLAVLHNVPGPHGTVEGFGCHRARREPPCEQCAPLEARFESRARARQRIADAERSIHRRQHGVRRSRPLART